MIKTDNFKFIYNLLYEDFSKGLGKMEFEKYITRHAKKYPQTGYLFKEEDALVGCGIVNEDICDHFMISYLFILPDHRGKGFGAKYFLELMGNRSNVVLWCEEEMIPFYKSLGFYNTNFYRLDLSQLYLMVNYKDYNLQNLKSLVVV